MIVISSRLVRFSIASVTTVRGMLWWLARVESKEDTLGARPCVAEDNACVEKGVEDGDANDDKDAEEAVPVKTCA